MRDLLPFLVSGLASRAIFALAGTGLTLTYKTSGIFNFGHGALATIAAYVFYWLHVEHRWNWILSFVACVVGLGMVLGLVMERLARQLARQTTAYKIVGTVGIVLFVQGLGTRKYGVNARLLPQFLPSGTKTFRLLDVTISYDRVIISVVALVAVTALYAVFRFSRIGTEMRAVVDDSELLDVQGTDPVRVRRVSWIVGSTFAALSGVLVAPLVGLESIFLTFLVVQAFGAAAIGAFSSIPLTFLGGLVIGVLSDVSKKYVIRITWLQGLPASLPFVILFLVLLVLPKRKLVPPATPVQRPHLPYKGPWPLRLVVGTAVVIGLAFVPSSAGVNLGFYSAALTGMVMTLSLGLLVKTSGQVSLCHAAFAAIGACAFSQLTTTHGVPWLIAVPLAALVVVPIGALIAIPAIRLSGLFLALATFGFGIMIERFVYPLDVMFTSFSEGRRVPRPSFARGDKAFYFVLLAFVVLTAIVMVAIHEGRLGRVLRGMSDSPVAVSTLGLSTNVTRVIVFCISSFFAAIAGILYASSVTVAASADSRFSFFSSLLLLATLAISPFREPWYVLPAAIGAVIPAYVHAAGTTDWLNVLFGFFAIVVALTGGPHAMPAALRAPLSNAFSTRRRRTSLPSAVARGAVPKPMRHNDCGPALVVEQLNVTFGGLVAVHNLTMHVPAGRITALIGPNGAGKTTTFNACSGLNRPSAGRILLHGDDVSMLSPAARARRGLGRTLKRMELCDTLSVRENVALGREAGQAGGGSSASSSRRAGNIWRPPPLLPMRWSSAGSRQSPTSRRVTCRPGSAGWWSSRARLPVPSTCCCSTSHRPASIDTRHRRSARS